MPKINVLEKHIAELIAAGEVVDRPCSVIKELVENSIDAGAKSVTVEIQNGGNTYMRVTDDGCGIEKDDIPKAFLRHATSKISEEDDLEKIHTFGFRGEALASVAAVSHAEILTRTGGSEIGYHCAATDCEIGEPEEAGCPEGTTIIVRDLFYNTPARQKFLKKDSSEGTAVSTVVEKMALSHPEIKFRFIRDGETKLSTYGNGDLLAVISSVFGRNFAEDMIEVNYTPIGRGNFRVSGYITKPKATKLSRTFQNFYVNGRFIRTKTAMAALEEAFKGSAMVGKYPGCVLNIEIPPETVDVNVHPAKTEVRFASEKEIFDLVYYGVKSALGVKDLSAVLTESRRVNKDFWERVSLSDEKEKEHFTELVKQTALPDEALFAARKSAARKADVQYDLVDFAEGELRNTDNITPYRIEKDISHTAQFKIREEADRAISEGREIPKECVEGMEVMKKEGVPVPEIPKTVAEADLPFGKLKYVGELFRTYILLESEEELIFIDKHAAHERILYEKIKSASQAFDCQYLITPLNCTLSEEQCSAVTDNAGELERLGIIAEEFGRGTVLIRALPFWLKPKDAENILGEIADSFIACKHDVTPEKLDHLYANIACRAAIKANDRNEQPELETIVSTLLNNPQIKYCPHGRPVSVEISKNKLEKMFGRLQ